MEPDELQEPSVEEENLEVTEESQEPVEELATEENPAEEIPQEVLNEVKSDRGQKRVQELANKARELEKENIDLRDKLVDEPTSDDGFLDSIMEGKVPYTGDYVKDLNLAEERGAQKAVKILEKKLAVRDRFMSDVNSIERDYPELRKGAENFDPDLTDELVKFYKDASNINPNLRLKPFVDRIMKLRKQSETRGKSLSTAEIVRQDNMGAVRPSGNIKRVEKSYNDMSLEELEAIVPR